MCARLAAACGPTLNQQTLLPGFAVQNESERLGRLVDKWKDASQQIVEAIMAVAPEGSTVIQLLNVCICVSRVLFSLQPVGQHAILFHLYFVCSGKTHYTFSFGHANLLCATPPPSHTCRAALSISARRPLPSRTCVLHPPCLSPSDPDCHARAHFLLCSFPPLSLTGPARGPRDDRLQRRRRVL